MNLTYQDTATNAKALFEFIEHCPTAYQTVTTVASILQDHGFTMLQESATWDLQAGGRYMITRNQSSILAFVLPAQLSDMTGYQIIATHGDSPAFKLKSDFEQKTPHGIRWNVERYGGMICSSWMDRPLSIAGRIVVAEEGRVCSLPVDLAADVALIPNVAIHMNRNVNEGVPVNVQVDMLPLCGIRETEEDLLDRLAKTVGFDADAIISHDLFLYIRDSGKLWGMDGELISAPRLDDLMCTYGALQGFLGGAHANVVPMLAVFDNEEVGSTSRQGAASSMLSDVLARIDSVFAQDSLACRLSSSCLVSADNAHAKHPNHPEYSDAQNAPLMGGGVVIKHQAEQRYATDAVSAALFGEICRRAGVPTQKYHNRSDLRGGSTLGNLVVSQIPFLTVDIGMAQLAMHSAYETAGVEDIGHLIRAADAFYHTAIRTRADGQYEIDPA